jgi:hypothetical protein
MAAPMCCSHKNELNSNNSAEKIPATYQWKNETNYEKMEF